ncbi:MAG TPA: non-homologous end-joining DNA ligase [Cytophagaceae bacterium]|jgi:bifunctional non-homologous end joining protein LigD
MGLKEYKAKRKFNETPEPEGVVEESAGKHKFVIQKHDASRLHYDFRLELEGVLKSWAVPKGPSLNPDDKRLAMMVEDHPMEYGSFEGIIPEGNYGAGTVMLWDEGTYHAIDTEGREANEKELKKGLHAGNLKFVMDGKKLKGEFVLVKLKNSSKGNEWLLIKHKDKFATDVDITKKDKSIVSKRTLEQIAKESGSGKSVWHSSPEKPSAKKEPMQIKQGRKAKILTEVKPMLATLVEEAFDKKDWIYEIKWDGYRAIAEVNFNDINIYSRNNLPFNEHFPTVTESLRKLGIQAVLDGEIVALDENGFGQFQLIQNYKRTGKGNIVFFVFDILYYNGYDLRDLTLLERKSILKSILPEDSETIKYNDHVEGRGIEFFNAAAAKNLEGIIAKKADSLYHENARSKNWLKIKTHKRQEAVIAGITEPRGGRKGFGALVLGVYEGKELVYIGHTGGGFNDASLKETYKRIEPLIQKESPFKTKPKTNMPVQWVKPELVCEVKFQEWTGDGHMRQPIFIELREDKPAIDVKREETQHTSDVISKKAEKKETAKVKKEKVLADKKETPVKEAKETVGKTATKSKKAAVTAKDEPPKKSSAKKNETPEKRAKKKVVEDVNAEGEDNGLNLENLKVENNASKDDAIITDGKITFKASHIHKVYWEEEGYTKKDLLEYYDKISPYILPYLKDRPENLRRNPNGYKQPSFFQKNMSETLPDWIETHKIYSESNDEYLNYMVCQNEAALLYMANLGCIEINPWCSRVQSLENPDYIVIDLDPQDVVFEEVIRVAKAVKTVLDKGGIEGFPKTSGSRGIHIYIPMGAKYDYDQAKQFAEILASFVMKLVPDITSMERMPDKRKNKIYLDYLQNRKGQTLAAPYCVRPKVGATVSTPLKWEEIKEGLHPSQFNIRNIFDRLDKVGDLFKGVMGKGVDIEKVLKKLQG